MEAKIEKYQGLSLMIYLITTSDDDPVARIETEEIIQVENE